ncbi:phage protease [Aquincola tertiaricarbonis]|uniref:Phage protease n=1 Tax=Aquincola tertiaricarbonis TaxID=391953 RepID=A0ABY4S4J0_AQUTE|nr:phage protease [Aquincola tertiaricarbonis]URI06633.1 phage protease [Aquincola tertiaricarbonis]
MRLLTALLAATLPLNASGLAQLLPAGEFAARDGRPGPGRTWKLSDEQGRKIAAELSAIAARTPVVIDYEHQTLHAATNGLPAPAAGWINSAVWRDGEGLFGAVDWTPRAKAAIAADEYRYMSPVIAYAEDGTVAGVSLAAITNYPALTGMDQVVAALNTRLTPPEHTMSLLLALCAALGLPNTTAEADAVAAVAALKTKADAPPPVPTALATALGLQAGATEAAALSAVQSLGKAHDTAALVAMQNQVNALSAQLADGRITATVDDAIKAGKLTPASRDAFIAIGRKDEAALTAALSGLVPVPGLGGQTQGDPTGAAAGGGGTAALSATQAAIAKQLGLDPEAYAKQLKASA